MKEFLNQSKLWLLLIYTELMTIVYLLTKLVDVEGDFKYLIFKAISLVLILLIVFRK